MSTQWRMPKLREKCRHGIGDYVFLHDIRFHTHSGDEEMNKYFEAGFSLVFHKREQVCNISARFATEALIPLGRWVSSLSASETSPYTVSYPPHRVTAHYARPTSASPNLDRRVGFVCIVYQYTKGYQRQRQVEGVRDNLLTDHWGFV